MSPLFFVSKEGNNKKERQPFFRSGSRSSDFYEKICVFFRFDFRFDRFRYY